MTDDESMALSRLAAATVHLRAAREALAEDRPVTRRTCRRSFGATPTADGDCVRTGSRGRCGGEPVQPLAAAESGA